MAKPAAEPARVAAVTGASSGIGAAVAAELASRGGQVFGLARRFPPAAQVQRPAAGSVAHIGVDVTDAGAVSRFFDSAGELDVLVIAAGGAVFGGVAELEPDALRELLAAHVVGAHHCVRAALPALRRRRGHIVFVGSMAARTDVPDCIGYSAAKYAQLGYARALALGEGESGVRVTTALVGATDTPLWDGAPGFDRGAMLSADAVARAIAAVLDLPPEAAVDELVITPAGGLLKPASS